MQLARRRRAGPRSHGQPWRPRTGIQTSLATLADREEGRKPRHILARVRSGGRGRAVAGKRGGGQKAIAGCGREA
uniref:Uncharacterized protein n=1 Tax=Kalanchoe fedtschenkoi TaxID=63787 RepID=A0A7N0URT6_KALFE